MPPLRLLSATGSAPHGRRERSPCHAKPAVGRCPAALGRQPWRRRRFKRGKRGKQMGIVLPLLGIAALLVFGFVVLITALTYDATRQVRQPP